MSELFGVQIEESSERIANLAQAVEQYFGPLAKIDDGYEVRAYAGDFIAAARNHYRYLFPFAASVVDIGSALTDSFPILLNRGAEALDISLNANLHAVAQVGYHRMLESEVFSINGRLFRFPKLNNSLSIINAFRGRIAYINTKQDPNQIGLQAFMDENVNDGYDFVKVGFNTATKAVRACINSLDENPNIKEVLVNCAKHGGILMDLMTVGTPNILAFIEAGLYQTSSQNRLIFNASMVELDPNEQTLKLTPSGRDFVSTFSAMDRQDLVTDYDREAKIARGCPVSKRSAFLAKGSILELLLSKVEFI